MPLVAFAVILLGQFFRNFKVNMASFSILSLCYSILIGLAVGALTGHVLTSPAVSIYVIAAIIMLDDLTADGDKLRIKKIPGTE